jgi:topoisomerase IA-like protein
MADNQFLGMYKTFPVTLHTTGKFGPYICWNNKNKSLKDFIQATEGDTIQLTLADVIPLLDGTFIKPSASTNTVLRQITNEASIRKGPYGEYIYWQKHANGKSKPKFLKFPACMPTDYLTCDLILLQTWFNTYYDVKY